MAFQFPLNPVTGQTFNPIPGVSYKWDGFGWVPLAIDANVTHGVQVLTASGTFTFPLGIATVYVSGCGGGGGGGGATGTPNACCGGGGSGAVAIGFPVSASPGAAVPVTIGTGGLAGTTTSGGNGGTTSFGGFLTLGGGTGGTTTTLNNASGGNAGGTDGQPGERGFNAGVAGQVIQSGSGGSTPWGAGGYGATHTFGSPVVAQTGSPGLYGAGGGGAATGASAGAAGGAGGPGILIVQW